MARRDAGILFDSNSDRIRLESTPTLKEIISTLEEPPELKLSMRGHTDNVGAAAANQALSDKRATTVKPHLAAEGIDLSRLQSKEMVATKPAAANTTVEERHLAICLLRAARSAPGFRFP